ncbi:VWA domain-containing protein [Octadecabacter sp. CECT 8868]|uniref:vWA domain-containing protein n=1 Tax=Octadecabacter algicola TaxID=2909342 RepID=UPI001F25F52C|nr:VWA domain-containing protein [Octadecabacter algicola]MCF2904898.1 VWA domain-containing protein [Octadecabacter algicola]
MSDDFDLDDLKSAMNAATPAPDAEAKARNIALATRNFADLQGSRDAARHITRPTKWTGVKDMLNKLTSRGGLTVTTAIVACGVMITTPQGRDILNLDPTTKVTTPETLAEPDATAIGSVSVTPAQAGDAQEESDLRALVEPAPAIVAEAEGAALLERSVESISISPAAPQALTRQMAVEDSISSDMAPAGYNETIVQVPAANTETFANDTPNPLKITSDEPVSTFSIDVDTAAYSVVRSSLTAGQLPPEQAVRIEEMINYFPYAYAAPEGPHPFQPTVNVFETPWNADTQLVHIGIQGEMPAVDDRPPLNLVFLIDTSGSMESADKLPLLRQSFRLMLDNLRPEDEVSIVTYAGSTSIALEPTAASDRTTILKALNDLRAGGSTNGQGGLEAAYAMAEQMTDDGDVSRVILATDGDFNVGLSDPRGLEAYIEDKRDSGTYLSVLGFGRGNLQDATMQSLAQNGNGTAAYIDTLSEAQKVLVDNLTGALFPIANDVKIQVEFNPATIAEYRLIGYETRSLAREDFNNDAVDAGELGAGHTVTAIYEVTPVGSPAQLSDPLRYQVAETGTTSDELGFLRLRYKAPGEDVSQLIETPFSTVGTPDTEALFAASMAGFGQLLCDDTYLGDWGWDDAIALANANRSTDQFGYRTEAVQLMRLAQSLSN